MIYPFGVARLEKTQMNQRMQWVSRIGVANQSAPKTLSTVLVYTKVYY